MFKLVVKFLLIFSLFVCFRLLLPFGAFATPRQISDNNALLIFSPDFNGSYVVWSVWPMGESDSEIFLFDGLTTKRITDNDTEDFAPATDGTNVVWLNFDFLNDTSKLLKYDGASVSEIANLTHPDVEFVLSDGYVVWSDFDGNDEEIYQHDGVSVKKITDNSYSDFYFDNDGDQIAWMSLPPAGDGQLLLYDGSTTVQLADAFDLYSFKFNMGRIIWNNGQDIYLYDGSSTILLDTGFYSVNLAVSDKYAVWSGQKTPSFDDSDDIYINDGTQTIAIDDPFLEFFNPEISGNKIMWTGMMYNSSTGFFIDNIFLWENGEVFQITNNLFGNTSSSSNAVMSGNNAVWLNYNWINPDYLPEIKVIYSDLNDVKAKRIWTSNGFNTWDWNASKTVTGDFNGDGRDDVGVMYDYKSTREAKIFVFLANASGGFDSPVEWWASGPGNWDASGATLTSGDFSGDGKDDIAALYDYASQRDVRSFVFLSTGSAFSVSEWWHAGINNWDAAGSMLTSGDYTGDGKADMAVFYGYAAERDVKAFVFPSSGNAFTGSVEWWHAGPGNWDWAGSMISSGDYTGDGKADLGVLYGYATERDVKTLVFPSSGSVFTGSQEWWHAGPGNWDWVGSRLVSGDYDGDGISDLGVFYGYGDNRSTIFNFNSTSINFSGSSVFYDSGSNNWPWANTKVLSGDFDGDGTDQIGAFFDFGVSYSGLFLFE